MKFIICVAAAAGLTVALTGCEATYTERQQAYVAPADGYYPAAPNGYFPRKTYRSEVDYYRRYNGING